MNEIFIKLLNRLLIYLVSYWKYGDHNYGNSYSRTNRWLKREKKNLSEIIIVQFLRFILKKYAFSSSRKIKNMRFPRQNKKNSKHSIKRCKVLLNSLRCSIIFICKLPFFIYKSQIFYYYMKMTSFLWRIL